MRALIGIPDQGGGSRSARSRKAFTLIEVMIAIVIVGILARLAVAQFNTYREQAKLRSSAQKVFQILSWARLQSEKTGNTLLVQFAIPYISVYQDKDNSGTITAGDTRLLYDSVENTVALFSATAGPSDVSTFTSASGFAQGTTTCGGAVCCDKTGSPTKPSWNSVAAICAHVMPTMPSDLEDGAIYLGSTRSSVIEKWAIAMNYSISHNPSLWSSQKATPATADWNRIR